MGTHRSLRRSSSIRASKDLAMSSYENSLRADLKAVSSSAARASGASPLISSRRFLRLVGSPSAKVLPIPRSARHLETASSFMMTRRRQAAASSEDIEVPPG